MHAGYGTENRDREKNRKFDFAVKRNSLDDRERAECERNDLKFDDSAA